MTGSFTVFVCSTFSDLSQEREGVLDAIRRLKLQHDSMEFFGARAEQPIETCLQEVRASDVLVVIVGHRYGSIVPDLGISYSEAEYAEGFSLKKPCLVYMRDDNVPILPRHMERDPEKLKLLERWKETLQSRHTVSTFQDGGRLAVQVAADLARTIRNLEEVTKARATVLRRPLPTISARSPAPASSAISGLVVVGDLSPLRKVRKPRSTSRESVRLVRLPRGQGEIVVREEDLLTGRYVGPVTADLAKVELSGEEFTVLNGLGITFAPNTTVIVARGPSGLVLAGSS